MGDRAHHGDRPHAPDVAVMLVLALVAVRVANPLASLYGRSLRSAFGSTAETMPECATASQVAAHPGLSSTHSLSDGRSAFAVRVYLARKAKRSLDLQHYIWHADLSGSLLFDKIRKAANRGVWVRLLLDDDITSGLDPTLQRLDGHPNINLRLFNPFVIRSPRLLAYLTDFRRLIRRMHNKSFTANGRAMVIPAHAPMTLPSNAQSRFSHRNAESRP